jgi:ABC-type uncharacterized transport system auxiliary subunit
MRITKTILNSFIIASIAVLLSGCFGSSPSQQQYLLNIKMPTSLKALKVNHTLKVLMTKSQPQYNTSEFIYRISEYQYLSDYYHSFMVTPSQMVTQFTVGYLTQRHLFKTVTTEDSLLQSSEYELQPFVEALYADYRDSAKPTAVIKIRYTLLDNQKHNHAVLLDHVFTESIPLTTKSSTALIVAWNTGMQRILSRLSNSLSGILSD